MIYFKRKENVWARRQRNLGENGSIVFEVRAIENGTYFDKYINKFSNFRWRYDDVTVYNKPQYAMKSHFVFILYLNIK